MIAKVSAAIVKLLKPLSSAGSSTASGSKQGKESAGFQRAEKFEKVKGRHLRVVKESEGQANDQSHSPPPESEPEKDEEALESKSTDTESAPPQISNGESVSQSIINMMATLQIHRLTLLKANGNKHYIRASKSQSQGGKFKKGTMFDERIE